MVFGAHLNIQKKLDVDVLTFNLVFYIGATVLVTFSKFGLFFHSDLLLPGNIKGGSITVPLTSCLTGLDQFVLQIKTKSFSCHTADSKPVKQEVNGTVILPL
jgi:hypothetical protein